MLELQIVEYEKKYNQLTNTLLEKEKKLADFESNLNNERKMQYIPNMV